MRHVWVIGAATLLFATTAPAFEGTIKLRTTALTADQLAEGNGGKKLDDAAILAMTPEQLAKNDKAQVRESMVYVSGSKVRMDMPMESKGSGYAVVDLDKGLTWFVVPGEKRYIEWSETDAKAIGEKMAQMKKMMTERMASMPPDQRKQVEAMMKNMQMPDDEAAPQPTVAITPLNKTQTVNGMNATLRVKYEQIFERRGGSAVVVVRQGVCTGCHMGVPPQMYNELQKFRDIRQCPNCHRILFYRPDAATV